MLDRSDVTYDSADDAWRGLVREVFTYGDDVPGVSDPRSVGSGFGRAARGTREVLAARVQIADPRNRLVFTRVRQFRLDYAIAQTIWALSKSNSVAPVAFYNPIGLKFSDDGRTVRSAIGPRLFGGEGAGQFHAALDKLRRDPSSRRAMLQIYLPSDLVEPTLDVSCTGSLHLLVRAGALHAIAHMRSQSALMVLPYDLFSLTMIHEIASICLGLELGTYWHVSNSAHVYEDELSKATSLLNEAPTEREPMSPMEGTSADALDNVIRAEQYIRAALGAGEDPTPRLQDFELTGYWTDMLNALTAAWNLRLGLSWERAGAVRLPSYFRRCLRLAHEKA